MIGNWKGMTVKKYDRRRRRRDGPKKIRVVRRNLRACRAHENKNVIVSFVHTRITIYGLRFTGYPSYDLAISIVRFRKSSRSSQRSIFGNSPCRRGGNRFAFPSQPTLNGGNSALFLLASPSTVFNCFARPTRPVVAWSGLY